jgi:ATP-dependent helicase/nuclease subunit B
MNLATLPANSAFLDTVARRWLGGGHAPGEGLILLPTRRAARELAEAFLRVSDGHPMLLPRITALGALDEAPLALSGALDLPPSIDETRRLAELARMIAPLARRMGGGGRADQTWALARELARLMDDAERAEVPDLHAALRGLADGAMAEHWATTLEFLDIVTQAWPRFLEAEGLLNPQARAVALLRAQARAWQDSPPDFPVWAAGATGGIPAVAALLKVVATRLPRGLVILPGLCAEEPPGWDESHPQAGLLGLLRRIDATLDDVARWDAARTAPEGRLVLLEQALLPAKALPRWREAAEIDIENLLLLETDEPQHEALAIALILREALQTPGRRAALITPDRQLATRVAAELLRFGVVADDSAGEPLGQTPPAVFLRLLAAVLDAELSPVALLALLKHPLAGLGMPPAACRQLAREIERRALRGPKPPPGLANLRRTLDGKVSEEARALLDALEAAIAPMLRLAATGREHSPRDLLTALIECAEALAATGALSGPSRLWAGEEGEALAEALAASIAALDRLPDQPISVLPGLLDALLEGVAVRGRRALRGRDEAGLHPRIYIWGLLEARLQSVDVAVLGGLVEGVWPPAADPGPWLNRQMRTRIGLRSPEEAVGQAAHDFLTLAASAEVAVLSCPRRRDNAPAVPARWLTRLAAYLEGHRKALAQHPAAHWAKLIDQPAGEPSPVAAPRPRPPVGRRPRRLSVTDIGVWLSDPYAIYARHILRLSRLDELEQGADAADYGNVVHAGIARVLRAHGAGWPDNAAAALREAFEAEMKAGNCRPALIAWWRPRLGRIADWIDSEECRRRSPLPHAAVFPEIGGRTLLAVDGGFELYGRADRIERLADGSYAILDYKTGQAPTPKDVGEGRAPQLTLEAAILARGGFAGVAAGEASELAYWKFGTATEPGKATRPFKTPAEIQQAAAAAMAALADRVREFDDPDTAYLAHPHPEFRPRFSDYAQLARVAEWSRGEEGE